MRVIFLIVLVDEGALVKGAKELGFFFKTRTPDKVTIEVVSYRVERRLLSGYLTNICSCVEVFICFV